jgi:hypothetical protein
MEKEQKQYRYPWHEAPEWARYAGADHDGNLWWFEKKPLNLFGYPIITGRYAKIIESNTVTVNKSI